MNAKKCDRCGKYYDLYEMDIPERYKDRMNGKMNFVALHGKDIERCDGMPTGSSRPIDLCPDCMDGLLGYLSGRTPEEAIIPLNRECDGYMEKIKSLEKMIYELNDPVFIPSPEERTCSECIADLPEDIMKRVHTVRIESDGAVTMYLNEE